jgi:hypothetical protein
LRSIICIVITARRFDKLNTGYAYHGLDAVPLVAVVDPEVFIDRFGIGLSCFVSPPAMYSFHYCVMSACFYLSFIPILHELRLIVHKILVLHSMLISLAPQSLFFLGKHTRNPTGIVSGTSRPFCIPYPSRTPCVHHDSCTRYDKSCCPRRSKFHQTLQADILPGRRIRCRFVLVCVCDPVVKFRLTGALGYCPRPHQ